MQNYWLSSWWKVLIRKARGSRSATLIRRNPRLRIEELESRRLLSTLTVVNLNDSGAGSLRGQIAAAAPGDTINFKAGLSGTVGLTSGELALNKNVSIVGPTGSASIAVSGSSRGRVFNIGQGKTVGISNLTVRDGLAFGLTIQGGGIENAGYLTLSNCTISNNRVISGFFGGFGAGIDNNHGTLTLNNCTVSNNTLQVSGSTVSVVAYGAGIYSSGALTMTGSTVSGNRVTGTATGSYINNSGGGGLAVGGAAVLLVNCTIAGNSVTATGGSSITAYGGGICFLGSNGSLTVTNSTLSGNTSTAAGGSARGGGLCSDGGALSLLNNIVTRNAAAAGPDVFGTISSRGNNLISNTTGSTGFGTSDLRNVGANLGSLANNGGRTQTMALLAGSPAIDAGKNAGAPAFDARGIARPQNGVVDIGAYEVSSTTATVTLSPVTFPNTTEAASYSQAITATGATAPFTFAVLSGSLPRGLALSTSGLLSGKPSALGTFNFTIRATATGGATGSRAYSLTVGAAFIAFTPTILANGSEGTAYNQTLAASGGLGPYTFSLLSGSLPTGLTLSSTGVLRGTPTNVGASNFVVKVASSGGSTATRAYTINTRSATVTVNPAALPTGAVGSAYSQTFTASGGVGPFTYTVTAGTLPGGLTLSSSGRLSGTPTANGTFNFTVLAKSSGNSTGTRTFALSVSAATVAVNPATLANGKEGTAYSQAFTATGSAAPYTFSLLSGALPGGFTLSSPGVLKGTPTTVGAFNFTIKATSATNATGARAFTMTVGAAAVTVAPASLAAGTEGAAYRQSLVASGGIGPYTYALNSGALPRGVTLSSNGTLSGTATTVGSYNFTIRATSAGGSTGTRAYTVAVNSAAIAVNPATLPNGAAGVAYRQTISSTGGLGTRTYAVTAGALPIGLTLNSGGLLSGTPTLSGTFIFTITASTSGGSAGSRVYALAVAA